MVGFVVFPYVMKLSDGLGETAGLLEFCKHLLDKKEFYRIFLRAVLLSCDSRLFVRTNV